MIQSLTIQNIVLIQQLHLQFHTGMQVLSGETGAGKSIVVDAVNLILGGRADRSLIRTGCEKGSVEAVFDTSGQEKIGQILEREKIDYDGSTVTVYREMTAGGKNVCRICGVLVSVSLLREIGAQLMDIHGQHEHQFLMDPEMHREFLDRMGDEAFRKQLEKTALSCREFLEVHRRYARLRRENDQKQRRMEELELALGELHGAKLKKGEEESLQHEILRLRSSEKIASVIRSVQEDLSLNENGSSTLEKIRHASVSLSSLKGYGEKNGLAERCESAYYELEEIVYELHRMLEENEHDPLKLEKAEDRLDLIRRLERKYGESVEAVLQEQRRMEAEYEQLGCLDDDLRDTAHEHKRLLASYRQESGALSAARKELAARFEVQMMDQLKDLGMEKTRFQAVFAETQNEKKTMPQPGGDDRIEFMISPNPGEPMKPLARIASGGELSRLMLAMKTLETEGNGVDCMVFDEIDTGISGRMAQVVAEKMGSISRRKQVICVTHLPQIAAAADYQYFVSKTVEKGRTQTAVRELDREGRIREVARMISGAKGSDEQAETYARSMIEASERQKAAWDAGRKI